METVQCCVFFVLESWQIQTTKRKRLNTLIFERNYLKTLIFYRVYNKDEEHKYSRSEFYYPEDPEDLEDLIQRLTQHRRTSRRFYKEAKKCKHK